MKTIKITIPEIHPSLNQILRMHYHKRNTENKKWAALVAFFDNRRKKRGPLKKARVKITYFFPDNRRRDPDNYSPKFLMDGLVNAGVIEDDSFRHVELTIAGEVDKDDPRTEIEVVET